MDEKLSSLIPPARFWGAVGEKGHVPLEFAGGPRSGVVG